MTGKIYKQEQDYLISYLYSWIAQNREEFVSNIAPVYKALNWKWQGSTPTKTEINLTINQLMRYIEEAIRKGQLTSYASTGGIKLEYNTIEENGSFKLSFVYSIGDYFTLSDVIKA